MADQPPLAHLLRLAVTSGSPSPPWSEEAHRSDDGSPGGGPSLAGWCHSSRHWTDLPLKVGFFIEKRKIDFPAGPGTKKKLKLK